MERVKKMKQVFYSTSQEETVHFAEKMGSLLKPSDVILLEGDLGAGKTTFTKGLAKGLGIDKVIKSPTFTIVREYKNGRLPLYHMDVYRLEEASIDELGLFEYFDAGGVSVVEWAHFIASELPDTYLKLTIKRAGDEEREIILESYGARYDQLLAEVINDDSRN